MKRVLFHPVFLSGLALIAGLWVGVLTARAKLTPTALIFNGVLYVLFLSLVLRG